MEDVTVDKLALLEAIRENRSKHRAIFEEAVAGYKDKALELLNGHIESVKSGRMTVIAVHLPVPEDHTKDYDRAIKMIEMSVGETIVLSELDFQNYVMDDWRWKQQFLTSNSHYSELAGAALRS